MDGRLQNWSVIQFVIDEFVLVMASPELSGIFQRCIYWFSKMGRSQLFEKLTEGLASTL